jgi:broad specificity phosphatase PhoE
MLVKHSVPEIEPLRPAAEWPLSPEGRLRCAPLAARLARFAPDVILASREPKAAETARIVGAHLGLAVSLADGLHEHLRQSVGWLERTVFEAAVADFFARPAELVFGEETAQAAEARFAAALERALVPHAGRNVVVVAHGTVIVLFVARLAGVAPFPLWRSLGLPALVGIDWPGGAVEAIVPRLE